MGAPTAQQYPKEYFAASALAAATNYPLWRAAAIGQSGFRVAAINVAGVTVPQTLTPYVYGFLPPYKGMAATVIGMTWARAAIFWGSDTGRELLLKAGFSGTTATVMPPLLLSTAVQAINQPIVRATVTLQDPKHHLPNVLSSLKYIYQHHGIQGLWLGTTAGVLKTVPKYVTAIAIKDIMENLLAKPDPSSPTYHRDNVTRMAIKSATAGVAGAALTNPLDAIRNEQFKTHAGLRATVASLWKDMGWRFMFRGMGKNIIAVAMPVGTTIFCTDLFIQMTQDREKERNMPMRGV